MKIFYIIINKAYFIKDIQIWGWKGKQGVMQEIHSQENW